MSQEGLIAEIVDDKIRYIIYQNYEKAKYKIPKKKFQKIRELKRKNFRF